MRSHQIIVAKVEELLFSRNGMKARTKLLLIKLRWMEELLLGSPSVYSLMNGLPGWESRAGLTRTIQRLEKEAFLESEGRSLERAIRLSRKGREAIRDTSDPKRQWSRGWDGVWRTVVFDIPESEKRLRQELRRALANLSFGCLQKSLWISPDPFGGAVKKLKRKTPAPGVLTFFECNEMYGGEPVAISKAAWNFKEINSRYRRYLRLLDSSPAIDSEKDIETFLTEEDRLWKEAISLDPLLPDELLPREYMGKRALRAKTKRAPEIIKALFKTTIF